MGTTLTNGVYLPNEGERNCYAGLKTNWEILDQKVADVTALQQAVAGALHREIVESLPTTDINPNTIYMVLSGTSATENVYNEFMYVNNAWELIGTSATDLTNYYTKAEVDGKLLLKANASDLTSHTGDTTIHVTTADKTSWNTVTLKANDSDVVHVTGNENVGGIKNFTDYTYIRALNFTNEVASTSSSSSAVMPIVTTVTYTDSSPSQSARLNLRITADGIKSLYPHESNQYALGLTSRKWSEVHSLTYYYGSSDTEFSDKFVTTDTDQTITGVKTWTNAQVWSVNCQRRITNAIKKGEVPSSSQGRNDYYTLNNGTTTYGDALGVFGCTISDSNVVSTYFHSIKNVAGSSTRTTFSVRYYTNTNEKTVETNGDIIPTGSAQNLGNSTSKWATINGLNPSSLSMPDLSNGIDISSYITISQPGVEDVHTSTYTPTVNGFISVCLSRNGVCGVGIEQGDMRTYAREVPRNDLSTRYAFAYLPVVQNVQVNIISCYADGIVSAKFFPCQGNV